MNLTERVDHRIAVRARTPLVCCLRAQKRASRAGRVGGRRAENVFGNKLELNQHSEFRKEDPGSGQNAGMIYINPSQHHERPEEVQVHDAIGSPGNVEPENTKISNAVLDNAEYLCIQSNRVYGFGGGVAIHSEYPGESEEDGHSAYLLPVTQARAMRGYRSVEPENTECGHQKFRKLDRIQEGTPPFSSHPALMPPPHRISQQACVKAHQTFRRGPAPPCLPRGPATRNENTSTTTRRQSGAGTVDVDLSLGTHRVAEHLRQAVRGSGLRAVRRELKFVPQGGEIREELTLKYSTKIAD
ncbi:hypothetical protein B0H10DRAFT_2200245 [Mycena sp. CBHHK59/15]|nr:hypothetical protein B0H10DRAFT_2200245 [Mycena sp. CBHHK59/15]